MTDPIVINETHIHTTMTDDHIRHLLRIWAMRSFGVGADQTALQYGVDLLQGREPIVRQD